VRAFLQKVPPMTWLAIGVLVVFSGIASGAPGDPLILGQLNDAGTQNTGLSTNSSGNAFDVLQKGTDSRATAVYGYAANGWGVYGGTQYGRGVSATATKTGTGVHAEAASTGTALRVVGKAVFRRSGILTIKAGESSATKGNIGGLTSSSLVLAVLQQNVTSRWVRAVVPNVANGSFTVLLNSTVSSDTKVAWFIVN
jgi:hypothetical protein